MRWLAVIALALCTAVSGAQITDTSVIHGAAMLGFHTDSTRKTQPSLVWSAEYKPPAVYMKWWNDIASCEGLTIDSTYAASTRFFYVNAWDFVDLTDSKGTFDPFTRYYALSYAEHQPAPQVFVAVNLIYNESVIKHEMYHIILHANDLPNQHGPSTRAGFSRCGLSESYDDIYSKAWRP